CVTSRSSRRSQLLHVCHSSYWGKMKAVRNFIDYALFIAFFPHLIAGPIIRARRFIPQIWSRRTPARIVVQSGIILVLSGLIKKMVFADRFAVVSRLVLQRSDGAARLAGCMVGLHSLLHAGLLRFLWLHRHRLWLREAAGV